MTESWPPANIGSVPAAARAKAVFQGKVDAAVARDKAQVEAEIAAEKAQDDAYLEWATNNKTADLENLATFSDTLSTLAVGGVERARAGAELVQKASAAIVTLYTGILALVFSVGDNPLPARGILAPLFLGLAVVLSTSYIAYIGPGVEYVPGPTPVLGVQPAVFQRLNAITAVAHKIATKRSALLRASVVSLGIGLAYIVLPFISFTHGNNAPGVTGLEPQWPKPDPAISSEALNALVYKAQVDEVAEARKSAATPTPADDWALLVGFGVVGVAAVVIVPLALRD